MYMVHPCTLNSSNETIHINLSHWSRGKVYLAKTFTTITHFVSQAQIQKTSENNWSWNTNLQRSAISTPCGHKPSGPTNSRTLTHGGAWCLIFFLCNAQKSLENVSSCNLLHVQLQFIAPKILRSSTTCALPSKTGAGVHCSWTVRIYH